MLNFLLMLNVFNGLVFDLELVLFFLCLLCLDGFFGGLFLEEKLKGRLFMILLVFIVGIEGVISGYVCS